MTGPDNGKHAGGAASRRLRVYNGGFVFQRRVRRILDLAGWKVSLGLPRAGDWVGIWGDTATAGRGRAIAERSGAPLLRVEDPFLRSLHPARVGHEPPLGLLLDESGLHFDARHPSDLETLLATHPLDDSALLSRARAAMERIGRLKLSKYSAHDPELAPPEPGYVLVIDQAAGDASVRASGGDRNRFAEMLYYAQTEHPHARILIRSHPETATGARAGHYRETDAQGRISFVTGAFAPRDLLDGAIAVYTLSSQMGFEAILAGHRPRVFGTPFYAGWGLTEDEHVLPRRTRTLTRAQLFAAAMMLYPTWYDPYRDRLCAIETVIDTLEAQARAWADDHRGWSGHNIRLWKRPHMQRFFGRHRRMRFVRSLSPPVDGRRLMTWGTPPDGSNLPGLVRVEDGFLRSRGLGADLVPPLSLALDDLGIYYDPSRPSRLERLIGDSPALPEHELARARKLIGTLRGLKLTKYNLAGRPFDPPPGRRILVPGQVEDDASILLGSPVTRDNETLLRRTREENPDAVLLYRPHPDVLAGLRRGKVVDPLRWADAVVGEVALPDLLANVDAVWTMTSLTGFEALLRGVEVVTLGAPFYAGWGLTRDLGPVPDRRRGPVSLEGLVHAALIAYPRYLDPATGLPCPVEVAVERLAHGEQPRAAPLRLMARVQGILASHRLRWW